MIKKSMKIIIVSLIAIAVIMPSIIYFSANLISYAEGGNNTNHRNIEFGAYFKEGEATTENINTSPENLETSLFLKINVKEEGYFNGKIALDDANFEFVSSDSEHINKLDRNEIELNQINAEASVEIEVRVKAKTEDANKYLQASKITLTGTYMNHEQRSIPIEGNQTVTLNYVSNATDEDVVSETSIITNKVLAINGEEKRVIQVAVKSGLRDNNYPIKEITVEASAPELDGAKPETSEIERENETILTYIYPKEVNLNDQKIVCKTTLLLYDNKTISSPNEEIAINQNEGRDNTANAKIEQQEESISKGKLSAGIEREIKQTTKININLIGINQNIEIAENKAEYEIEDHKEDANIYYIQSELNKENILDILGEDGIFTILDENGTVLYVINKDTLTDENGNILISYDRDQTKAIKFATTEPKKLGTINIQTTKVIKASDKNIVDNATQIVMTAERNGETQESKIRLDNTKSEAIIDIDKKEISTLDTNKIGIKVEFLASNEAQSLYKNPEMQIVLPPEVKEVNLNSVNKIYADQFEIGEKEVRDIEGIGKVICIKLNGEQEEYNEVEHQEMGVIIDADVALAEETPSKETSVKMLYRNENDGDQINEVEKGLNIVAQTRETENVDTPEGEGTPEVVEKEENIKSLGNLKIQAISAGKELKDGDEINEGQTVKMLLTLTNNTGNKLTNVKLKAKQENGIFYIAKVGEKEDTSSPNLDIVSSTRIVEDETLLEKEIVAEQIENGESFTFEYEFSVKEKPSEETIGTATIEADGIEPQAVNLLTNTIKDAELKLNIFYARDEEAKVHSGEAIKSELDVKNISEGKLENIIVEIPLGDDIELEAASTQDMDNIKYLGTENKIAKFRINSLEKQQKQAIYIPIMVKEYTEDEKQINISFMGKVNGNTYYSNVLSKNTTLENEVLTVEQEGSIDRETVQDGEPLIYTANISNKRNRIEKVTIKDSVPKASVVKKAYIIIEGKRTEIRNISNNEIEEEITIPANGTVQLIVETTIDINSAQSNKIRNQVAVRGESTLRISNTVEYTIEGMQDPADREKNEISGILWIDENENGQRDDGEEVINNKTVKLFNAETGKQVLNDEGSIVEIKTNEQGRYTFNNLENGQYIVLVEYDKIRYSVTEYRKEGVSATRNNDAIARNLDGQEVAITDVIDINANSVRNIDIGFNNKKIFDMSLQKTVREVTVKNNKENRKISYNNQSLAKVEVDRKLIDSTNIVVTYEIKVTNEGEIAGYVNDIVDKAPTGFKFDQGINKEWYQDSNGQLHSESLSNEIINPGESKVVLLTLSKAIDQNSLGSFINTAEITKSTNDLLIEDMDSVAGNNAKEEDDQSTAELIISVKTGAVLVITIIIAVIAVILAVVAIIINKRRKENA